MDILFGFLAGCWLITFGIWIFFGPIKKDWTSAIPVALIMLVFSLGMLICAVAKAD